MPLSGNVNARRDAVLQLTLYGPATTETLNAVVDTGFDGSLLLPRDIAARLGLPVVSSTHATLADGTLVLLDIAVVRLEWLSGPRTVFVYVAAAPDVLLGVSLLAPHRLLIDYGAGTIEIS